MTKLTGTNKSDFLFGTLHDDEISGLGGNDYITGLLGDDKLDGGAGNDVLHGGFGKDVLDGGAGNDRVVGDFGNDIGVYRVAENTGATDFYYGGVGEDTLRIVLTEASPAVQADLRAFREFLANNADPNSPHCDVFEFKAFDLTVRDWEKLEVVVEKPTSLPIVSIANAQATEGQALAFKVSVDKADADSSITATYTISFGTGAGQAATGDLASGTVLMGTVEIPAKATEVTVAVPTLDDNIYEGTERFTVTLSNLSTNVKPGDLQAIGTILDNESLPTLSISDGVPNPATEGTDASLTFTVSLSHASAFPVTVDYGTIDGSAAAGQDYAAATDQLVFAPVETTKQVAVRVLNDSIQENPEAFTVQLTNARMSGEALAIADGSGTGNIVDDDAPVVLAVLSIADAQATEGQSLAFKVAVDKADAADITATYTITFGTGAGQAAANDLAAGAPLTGTVTIKAGSTEAGITVLTSDDVVFEGNETFTVTLSNLSANVKAGDLEAKGTILDNESLPTLSISEGVPNPATEGTDANITFTVTLSGAAAQPVAVDYATVDDTAVAGQDYVAAAAALVFEPGTSLSQQIVVPVVNDNAQEVAEAFTVRLSNAKLNGQALTIADDSGTGSIVDDDAPVVLPFLSIADAQATEGQSLSFVAAIDKADSADVTATYTITLGTGAGQAAANDLAAGTPLTGTVTIKAGETQASIVVPTLDDKVYEGNEAFTVTLSNISSNAKPGDVQATGTIQDNEALPTLSISDGVPNPVTEGTDASITYTVSLSHTSAIPVTADYTTVNGTATAGQDYEAKSGQVAFAPLETAKQIVVPVLNDNAEEVAEAFTVKLSNAKLNDEALTIADDSGTGNIIDDDAIVVLPVLSVADAEATEGQGLAFVVSVDKTDPNAPITATYTISFGTGAGQAAANDLASGTSLTGTVEIKAGETQASITVPTTDDTVFEGTESFTVALSNLSTNAQPGDLQATGTILDNETLPTLSISDGVPTPATEGTDASVTFTVSLSHAAAVAVTVDYGTANGSALAGQDYEARTGQLVFQPGASISQQIVVPVLNDSIAENPEAFTVQLSNARLNGQALTIADAGGTGNIVDDDQQAVLPVLSIADAQATEGQALGFVVSVDKADPSAQITATYTINFPDGASAADLAAPPPFTGQVTIPANQTSATIQIPTLDDRLGEGTETFAVTLSDLSANAKPGDLEATGTILDNEPVLSIADAQATEGGKLSFLVKSAFADATAPITATYSIAFPDGATARPGARHAAQGADQHRARPDISNDRHRDCRRLADRGH